MIFLVGMLMVFISYQSTSSYTSKQYDRQANGASIKPIQVDFFVMSRCPDAAFCESLFFPSLIQLSSIVNFTLSFIASKSPTNEFQCMHGQNECLGNRQQLCIQNMYSPTISLKYLLCQSSDITLIPDNGETCAKNASEGAINWSDVQACVNSERSNELFDRALQRTQAAAAMKSCTIHMNGKFWCMHDRYWQNCSEGSDPTSFIRAICSRYSGRNPPKECTSV